MLRMFKLFRPVVAGIIILVLTVTQFGYSFAAENESRSEVFINEASVVTETLKKLNVEEFNKYVLDFINKNKKAIEDSIINEKLDRFDISEIEFDIGTGGISFNFSAHYVEKILGIPLKITFTGKILAKLKASADYSQLGIQLTGLENFKIAKCPESVENAIKDYLNTVIPNVFFWQEGETPAGYVSCDINNLRNVIQGLLEKEASKTVMDVTLPGGTVKVLADTVQCDKFDIGTGDVRIKAFISLDVNLFSGKSAFFKRFCSIELEADLYMDETDNIWLSLRKNVFTLKDGNEGLHKEINGYIEKELVKKFGKEKLIKLGGGIEIEGVPASNLSDPVKNGFSQTSLPCPVIQGNEVTTEHEFVKENSLNRPNDPIVIRGQDISSLNGINPDELVAFKYDGGWKQIPVQVDERAAVSVAKIYNASGKIMILFELAGRNDVSILTYTDRNTFTSGDPDKTLDSDDEIVFMSKDAGGMPADFSEPAGVTTGSAVRIMISDPLDKKGCGCVYLFRQDGTLDQSAGKQYVKYDFKLLSGDYKTTYKTGGGPNKEDSAVTTPYYSCHFSDRWIRDEIHIMKGNSNGVDILDRHKELFKPGVPTRTEDTFCEGADTGFPAEGCFAANISGPVRAIRSYMGANSGFITQREHIFYEDREDINTYLRVHPISGVVDFLDYSPAAAGMTYTNDLNKSGVIIDGKPDTLIQGPIKWEMAGGNQGSLVTVHNISCDLPGFSYTSYYLDNNNPQVKTDLQFTGDPYAYGSSGIWVDKPIDNTDPTNGMAYNMILKRYMYFENPWFSTEGAEQYSLQSQNPFHITVSPYGNNGY